MPRERALHLYLEASRLAYADRGAFVGRPRLRERPAGAAALRPVRGAAPGQDHRDRGDRARSRPAIPSAVTDTSASTTRIGSTTNLTVTDRWGNVVDYTFTIEQTGGNGMVVPGYGFLLNNELTDFNLTTEHRPGRPGGVSTGANKVSGGKRPRSSIAPTIVLRNGRPFLALGSPGGASIITTVAQILVNRLDFGMTLPDAVAAPRLSQRNSATTQTEPGFGDDARGRRARRPRPGVRGHHAPPRPRSAPRPGIEFLPGGMVLAAAEPVRRGGGSAAVVSSGGHGHDGHGGRHVARRTTSSGRDARQRAGSGRSYTNMYPKETSVLQHAA